MELIVIEFRLRQTDGSVASTAEPISYTIHLPTSSGDLLVPQLGGELSLDADDSKIFVTNYEFGSNELLYSTGEIFTWYARPVCLIFCRH